MGHGKEALLLHGRLKPEADALSLSAARKVLQSKLTLNVADMTRLLGAQTEPASPIKAVVVHGFSAT